MERPSVRLVQQQQEFNNEVHIDSWEAEQLLRKYGHKTGYSTYPQPQKEPEILNSNELTFEEMIAKQAEIDRREKNRLRALQTQNGPKPKTFNGNNGYNSEVKYASDADTGFGFKIEVTTDMNLPRY
jgi:hypothetical protein